MILAFKLSDIITVPFGYLLGLLYQWTNNYGVAMIIFAVVVKLILFPISAKGKKSSMKMSRLSPRMQEIQKKYADDPQRQNEAVQALYKEEGVSMGGSCLWSFIPLLILFPLYTVIREPIAYMLQAGTEAAGQIVELIKGAAPQLFGSNAYYDQIIAARHIPEFAAQIIEKLPDISQRVLEGADFNFIGLDLGTIPTFNIFKWEAYDWAHIGAFLIPIISAGSQVLSMFIMNKLNNSVVTDKNGVHDEETAKNSQAAQTTKTMMFTMPLMSLWIGFTVPAALSLYWIIQGFVSIVQDVILTSHYRKVYDAEDAVRLQLAMEREKEEAEKERLRAERRNANPDGITANTSKKKLQQKQKEKEQSERAAAAKEYAAKKGIVEEPAEKAEKTALSGIADRPYAKGRAYDPNRYRTTEE